MQVKRLAGLGALGAAAGIAVLFAAFVWWTWPGSGGMDLTHTVVAWIGVGGIVVALIAVHVVYGRVLLRSAADDQSHDRGGPAHA